GPGRHPRPVKSARKIKNPAAGGSGVEISSNFLEGLLRRPEYSKDPPCPLPPVGRVGRQQQQQQQAAEDTMAQAAATPLRSLFNSAFNRLTVSPRRLVIYAQRCTGSTGFYIATRIFDSTVSGASRSGA